MWWFFYVRAFLFLACLVSNFVYISLLYTIHKWRHEPPFSSSFFRFAFNLGLLDLFHLDFDWLFFRLPSVNWVPIHKLLLLWPRGAATFVNFVNWFTALAQILAVSILAANRVSVIGFHYVWSCRLVRFCNMCIWLIPFVACAPMFVVGHNDYYNSTEGGIIFYWLDPTMMRLYFFSCVLICIGSASFSAILYVLTFYRVRIQKAQAAMCGSTNNQDKTEIKLAIVGVVLCLLTALYAIDCYSLGITGDDPDLLAIALLLSHVQSDVFSWINPYLLLICSDTARKKMIMMYRNVQVNPTTNNSNDGGAANREKEPIIRKIDQELKVEECSV